MDNSNLSIVGALSGILNTNFNYCYEYQHGLQLSAEVHQLRLENQYLNQKLDIIIQKLEVLEDAK